MRTFARPGPPGRCELVVSPVQPPFTLAYRNNPDGILVATFTNATRFKWWDTKRYAVIAVKKLVNRELWLGLATHDMWTRESTPSRPNMCLRGRAGILFYFCISLLYNLRRRSELARCFFLLLFKHILIIKFGHYYFSMFMVLRCCGFCLYSCHVCPRRVKEAKKLFRHTGTQRPLQSWLQEPPLIKRREPESFRLQPEQSTF